MGQAFQPVSTGWKARATSLGNHEKTAKFVFLEVPLISLIDLENVGTQVSRMRVRAEESGFFSLAQDEKMAAEIIKETALVLKAKGHFNY